MNLTFTRLLTAWAFVVTLGLGASKASAQSETAKFNLPVEARWGSILLRPGNYTLRTRDLTYGGTRIFYLEGNQGTKIMVPTIVNTEAASGSSRLKLVNVDGTYYVQEYVSAAKGVGIEFRVPKSDRRLLTAQDREASAQGF